jgi:hypothetical protein
LENTDHPPDRETHTEPRDEAICRSSPQSTPNLSGSDSEGIPGDPKHGRADEGPDPGGG